MKRNWRQGIHCRSALVRQLSLVVSDWLALSISNCKWNSTCTNAALVSFLVALQSRRYCVLAGTVAAIELTFRWTLPTIKAHDSVGSRVAKYLRFTIDGPCWKPVLMASQCDKATNFADKLNSYSVKLSFSFSRSFHGSREVVPLHWGLSDILRVCTVWNLNHFWFS